jgi:hypothetical protein
VSKRRVVIGNPATVTPEDARRTARDTLARVRLGADPAGERSEERRAETVKELTDLFMARHVEPKRKGTTASLYRQVIRSWIVPQLGPRKAIQVTRADVARLHEAVAAGKGGDQKARGGRTAANRAVMILASLYGWADKTGYVPEGCNPARRLEKFKEVARERFLDDAEFQRLGAALVIGETVGIQWKAPDPTKKRPSTPQRRRLLNAY